MVQIAATEAAIVVLLIAVATEAAMIVGQIVAVTEVDTIVVLIAGPTEATAWIEAVQTADRVVNAAICVAIETEFATNEKQSPTQGSVPWVFSLI